jgi:DNA ligase-1
MIKPMLCCDGVKRFTSGLFEGQSFYASPKLDGVRCFAVVEGGSNEVTYYSRNGKIFKNFSKFDTYVLNACREVYEKVRTSLRGSDYVCSDTFILDGEVSLLKGVDQDFSKVMKQVHRLKEVDASILGFHVFDLPCLPHMPFAHRYSLLSGLPVFQTSDCFKCVPHAVIFYSKAKEGFILKTYMNYYISSGYEGVVFKTTAGVYEEGKRSSHWLKMKPRHTLDLPVLKVVEGRGKHVGKMGALMCSYAGYIVKVGTGFTDEEREAYWKEPPSMIEVKYQERTKAGSLRFPVYVRAREDKG